MSIQILCNQPLQKLSDLKPHPKNRNEHPAEQISRLAKLFLEIGVRHPIIVSNRSGFIVAGHARLAAARLCQMEEFPVSAQDFESEEQEYAFLVGDNAVSLWAELDLRGIGEDILAFGPDFDLELLGLKDFSLDPELGPGIEPELEFSREIDEKNNYLVFLFKTPEDFERACDKFKVQRVNISLSPTGREDFVTQGRGRVLDGAAILD